MGIKEGSIEFFKRLQMAEKYCNGNTEKAKQLANGEFDDIAIIKGRFSDEDEETFGLFILFISRIYYRVVLSFFLYTNYTVALQNKPIHDWKTFFSKIEKELANPEFDMALINTANLSLKESLTIKEILPLLEWMDENNFTAAAEFFIPLLEKVTGKEKIDVDLDFENTDSFVLYEKWKIGPPKSDEQ